MGGEKPLVLLFADTDLAATRPLRVELRRRGAKVHLVGSALEAIGRSELEAPDLVVIDEGLTRDGEIDLLAQLREKLPEAKFILLSAGPEAPPPHSGPPMLFSAHKPVSKETLLEVLRSIFPGRLGLEPVPRPKRQTLLCVDDDRTYLNSLERFLKRRGYEVYAHESARTALEVLPEIRPELAIVDIMMPGMDGLELTRRIDQDYKGKVPVVVLTAQGSKEMYRRAKDSGASYCLTKPCKPEDFLNVIDFIAGDLDQEERELLRQRVLVAERA